MRLRVKTSTGRVFSLNGVDSSWTVREVYRHMHQTCALQDDEQALMMTRDGVTVELPMSADLLSCGVRSGGQLFLGPPPRNEETSPVDRPASRSVPTSPHLEQAEQTQPPLLPSSSLQPCGPNRRVSWGSRPPSGGNSARSSPSHSHSDDTPSSLPLSNSSGPVQAPTISLKKKRKTKRRVSGCSTSSDDQHSLPTESEHSPTGETQVKLSPVPLSLPRRDSNTKFHIRVKTTTGKVIKVSVTFMYTMNDVLQQVKSKWALIPREETCLTVNEDVHPPS
eukprot:Sspe_Gene.104943::Locus_81980_Transcript_1_1_Confidence_1.000_Length_1048::g.104943::m.104943